MASRNKLNTYLNNTVMPLKNGQLIVAHVCFRRS